MRRIAPVVLAATALFVLAAPAPASAQIPLLQYVFKRVYKEFGRGVRVRSFPLQEPTRTLTEYQTIEVGRFENEILELMPYQMNEELAAEIAAALTKQELFQVSTTVPGSENPAALWDLAQEGSHSADQSRRLLLSGSVRDFYPGHEALRAVNMGLRSLYTIVQVRLQDKTTGEELYRGQIVVEVYRVRGGAYRTALRAVEKEVASDLKKYRLTQSAKQNVNHDGNRNESTATARALR